MGTKPDDTSFHMCDVQLWIGNTFVDPLTAPDAEIPAATSASLVFTTQKIGVRGKFINHAYSITTHCCPIRALARRIIHICQHAVSYIIPIAS
jgi:predicted ArsR family transcriptional regulator